jgi:hypothetical protein
MKRIGAKNNPVSELWWRIAAAHATARIYQAIGVPSAQSGDNFKMWNVRNIG